MSNPNPIDGYPEDSAENPTYVDERVERLFRWSRREASLEWYKRSLARAGLGFTDPTVATPRHDSPKPFKKLGQLLGR